MILGDVGRVQHCHRQRDGPHPKHLEDPEAQELEEFVADLIEAIVFSSFDDPKEQKAGQSGSPEHDKERGDNLACMMLAGE